MLFGLCMIFFLSFPFFSFLFFFVYTTEVNGPQEWFGHQHSLKYTTSQKFLNSKICNVFERILFCSLSLHLFESKYSKYSNILKYLYYLK